MKKILPIVAFLIGLGSSIGQCTIDQFIQDNYERDAHILAMREIISNPSHPDFDNPYPSADLAISYLERLTALYENPLNSSEIDAVFNDFKIHVNEEYNVAINFNELIFSADTNLPWIDAYKNTGVSGIPALDNLMTTHQFTLDGFTDLMSCSCTHFTISTPNEYMNLYALIDDFESISDINYAEVLYSGLAGRFNYTGIPHTINGFEVELCDILVDGNRFRFALYANDCFSGCIESESRYGYVNSACEVLGTTDFSVADFNVYPNPAQNELYFENTFSEMLHLKVYNIAGKVMLDFATVSEKIDVSSLPSGMYFLTAETSEKKQLINKFIKN